MHLQELNLTAVTQYHQNTHQIDEKGEVQPAAKRGKTVYATAGVDCPTEYLQKDQDMQVD